MDEASSLCSTSANEREAPPQGLIGHLRRLATSLSNLAAVVVCTTVLIPAAIRASRPGWICSPKNGRIQPRRELRIPA